MEYEFIIDEFTLKRGEPVMFVLHCKNCNCYLFTYQKDGPGPLLRCYWDRIHAPEEMKKLQKINQPHFYKELRCKNCHTFIGKKSVYEKENRLVFTLDQGSFITKKI